MNARTAAWFAYASGVVALVGVVLLMVFFAVGNPYGTLNDIAIVIQYLLAIPLVFQLYQEFRGSTGRLNTAAAVLGIAGIAAVVVLTVMLIVGVLSFEQSAGPVSVALLLGVGGWLLLAGYLGRVTGTFRYSLTLGVIGWTYLGYPVWALGLGRQLSAADERRRGVAAPPPGEP